LSVAKTDFKPKGKQKSGESGNPSLDRLFRVLECLASNRIPNRLVDLSQKLQMPQSTVLRYVQSLCRQGYAYHDERTGRYALTWKICKLSDSVKGSLVLRSMASPFLNMLANTLNVGACLVVMDGDNTMYLDFVDNPSIAVNTMIRIGKSAPIHSSGSGKVLLSALSARRVNEIIDSNGLSPLTPYTITTKDHMFAELDKVRRCGWALDDEECEEGNRCISVPLYDYSGCVVAAISVFDATERLPDQRIEREILPELRKAAREISYRMGFTRDISPTIARPES
jgi:DNA-binding IclR family transcriptional regulator